MEHMHQSSRDKRFSCSHCLGQQDFLFSFFVNYRFAQAFSFFSLTLHVFPEFLSQLSHINSHAQGHLQLQLCAKIVCFQGPR